MNDRFTKDDLARDLKEAGLVGTMHHSTEIVEYIVNRIGTALADGFIVDLRSLGRLQVRSIPPATRRNPKSGEPIRSAGRSKVAFKPSAQLTRKVQP